VLPIIIDANAKLLSRIASLVSEVRENKPLIHHITNQVVMNDTANVTLHIGALPVMSDCHKEMEDMVSLASALVINIGTLNEYTQQSMGLAASKANQMNIPIVIDPVGAGATHLRTTCTLELLTKFSISILRGNSGEIGALSGDSGAIVKGVESIQGVADPIKTTEMMAKKHRLTCTISGKNDIISDGSKTIMVSNGHIALTSITGTGCMATTLCACFAAIEKDSCIAAAAAHVTLGICSEIAARTNTKPGSFKVALLDEIATITGEKILKYGKVKVLGGSF